MKDTAPSRTEARVMGYPFYEGAPCKRGHQGIRYVVNKACRDCEAQANKGRRRSGERKPEHWRNWKAANPDKVRASRERRKAARLPVTEARKASQQAERDRKALERAARREARLAARLTPEERKRRRLEHDRAKAAFRRAVKRGAEGERVTARQLATMLFLQRGGCAYCGDTDNLHLDHKQPIARGGQHVLTNLQWLCAGHNMSKHDTPDLDYRAWQTIPFLTPWDADYGRTFLQASALA